MRGKEGIGTIGGYEGVFCVCVCVCVCVRVCVRKKGGVEGNESKNEGKKVVTNYGTFIKLL